MQEKTGHFIIDFKTNILLFKIKSFLKQLQIVLYDTAVYFSIYTIFVFQKPDI